MKVLVAIHICLWMKSLLSRGVGVENIQPLHNIQRLRRLRGWDFRPIGAGFLTGVYLRIRFLTESVWYLLPHFSVNNLGF